MYKLFIVLALFFVSGFSAHADYEFPVAIGSASVNPATSTLYYWGAHNSSMTNNSSLQRRVGIPVTGTITDVDFFFVTNGTVVSSVSSTMYMRINGGATTTLLTDTFADQRNDRVIVSGLSVPVVSGDYVELLWQTPSGWTTLPTTITTNGNVLINVAASSSGGTTTLSYSVDTSAQTLYYGFIIIFISMMIPLLILRKK